MSGCISLLGEKDFTKRDVGAFYALGTKIPLEIPLHVSKYKLSIENGRLTVEHILKASF